MLPDAGSVRLPRLLPAHIAREMLLTGRRMGADEAAHHGLVNRVVSAANLQAAAQALAAEIVASAPLSVAAILDIERRTAAMQPIDAMREIKSFRSYRAAIDSEDAREGTIAFAEQRPPVWRGR
jgi:crotonobetainyl-CoA hydratase